MDEKFYKALQIEQDKGKHKGTSELLELLLGWFKPQYALGILLLALGVLGGYFFKR